VRNKANSGRPAATAYLPIWCPGAATVQTKPICRRARRWARVGALSTPSVRNKANRPALSAGMGPGGRGPWAAVQTNQIPRRCRRAKQSQFVPGRCRARACPELAEGTPNPRRAEGNRAKQSQFPGLEPKRWMWNRQLRAECGNLPPYAGHARPPVLTGRGAGSMIAAVVSVGLEPL